jgi:hypothetical protein
MDVTLGSAEMFYVDASRNDIGSSWQMWTNSTEHYSETSIHYVVERKKMQEITEVGKN